MMGKQQRTESLFYCFRLEDQIPNDHLLRLIDRHIDFTFVPELLRNFYSSTGRPSIDPEVLLRLLLIGYLYGITSERRLMDEVRMHLAYRWFSRLGFEQELPDHSTFSKNRHGRFRQSGVFRKVFEEIVQRCLEAGLVEGRNLAVDGTLVGANASQQSRVPRERLIEAAPVSRTVQEYLADSSSRTLWQTRTSVRLLRRWYRRPIPMQPGPSKVGRQLWDTTTTISSTRRAV
jgi:transposase